MTGSRPRRLSILDAAFLGMETRDTPMHVGALLVFSLPKNAPADFVQSVVQRYRTPTAIGRPWNLKLAPVMLGRLLPAMVETGDIDFHYHVRHSALPDPGGERELGELISHLHSQPLDRTRPLWTCHVIEGLHDRQFAIYIKIHHALADGIKGARMICASLRDKPGTQFVPPWESQPASRSRTGRSKQAPASLAWLKTLPGAFKPLFVRKPGAAPVLRPFEAPNSALLNGRVTGARRIATQQLELDRIKRIARRAGASVNDVFLAVCSAALRRHLLASDALPAAPLTAGVPMSLRADGDDASGNAVGFVWASLATDVDDPRARIAAIRASIGAWKQHLQSLDAAARLPFATLTFTPAVVALVSGFGAQLPPPMNVIISNVPGPERHLYLGGARLEAMYPVSIPVQGLALNITCVSYAGTLNVGFTGSRDRLPHLQRLAVYARDALDELDAAI
ncbi:MAG TPA: wax ester/triacylglycerol synthase family O-acyltransferase [Solimonas sp.]|nr:wax ester/triacylglycerol synthase family O-acyltransferase [Solimonas sp.]